MPARLRGRFHVYDDIAANMSGDPCSPRFERRQNRVATDNRRAGRGRTRHDPVLGIETGNLVTAPDR
jgi:hypothetical protein